MCSSVLLAAVSFRRSRRMTSQDGEAQDETSEETQSLLSHNNVQTVPADKTEGQRQVISPAYLCMLIAVKPLVNIVIGHVNCKKSSNQNQEKKLKILM